MEKKKQPLKTKVEDQKEQPQLKKRGRPKGSKDSYKKKIINRKKGVVNNPKGIGLPKGRPPGTKNKVNREIKDAFKKLITDNIDNFEKWLMEVAKQNPKDALKLIIDLSPYVVPKLSSQDLRIEDVKEDIDLSKLSKEELEQFLKLVEKTNVDTDKQDKS